VARTSGAYWQTFGYNAIGNREQSVEHSTTGGTDVTTTYVNGAGTGTQPHTLAETKGGGDPTKFVYDLAGNLLTRTANSAKNQTLKWDNEGRLAQVTTTGATPGTTKYLYDADGSQLIRRDPGRTSLFVGDTEIVINTAVSPAVLIGAVRTYSHGGAGAVAMRSTLPGGGAHYLFGDPHGTASLSIGTTTQAVARQQYKPYGENRAVANTTLWPDPTRGYLSAPKDTSTGYTDLGARKYDPVLGRFISADPLLQITDPAQLGGYTYAGDNPITLSDPTGLSGDTGNGSGNGVRFRPDTGKVIDGGTGNVYDGSDDSDVDEDAVEVDVNGNGEGTVGGVTVTVDQVDSIYAFGNQVNYAYFHFSTNSKGWDALDDNLKLLKMMDWACQQVHNQCTTVYANAIHSALIARYVKANGGDPLYAGGVHLAVNEDAGGADAAAVGRMLSSTRTSMRSFDMLDDMAEGVGRACVRGNSFAPETRVLLADGTARPIADIRVGDKVLATDPETGETHAEEVTALHENTDTYLVNLTVEGVDGHAVTVRTTEEHPFWSPQRQRWIDAGELASGEFLGAEKSHGTVTVEDVHPFTGRQTMYNLTVAELHTYYVLAGTTPVLVHNCGEGIYEAGGKHGPTARSSSRGTNSAEPRNGQGAFDNSFEWTPEGPGQAPRRIGVSDGEIVILDRTRQVPCGCSRDGGMNDIWHGHVRGWSDLSPGMQSGLRKAGLVDRKGRPL
jgi:RHS repeat-associated protein